MQAKDIALGGLLSALTLIILAMTYVIPTNTLTLLTLASFTVPLALIRSNSRTAVGVYFSSALLAFLFLPLNISIMYGLFFGSYGLVKYWVEHLDKPVIEWILKFAFFNTVFFIGLSAFMALVNPGLLTQLEHLMQQILPSVPNSGFWALFVLGQIAFVIFDYALMLLIDTYYNYFKRGH